MLSLGQDEIAKYPFLADAGQYLKDKNFTLEQFGTDPDLKIIVDKAYHRIETAANGKIYKSDITENEASSDATLPKEIFSFLLAIVLLKLSGMNTLIRRFALAEARRSEQYLAKDLANLAGKNKELATKILAELFSLDVKKNDDFFIIKVADYLKHSINFHEREWKLINRKVDNGFVFLTPHEIVRLVRKELGNYISSKIQTAPVPASHGYFEEHVSRLVLLAKKFSSTTTSTDEYPPCIKHAIEVLEKGENLSHSGRFMLATFLLSKGQSIEQIAPLFKNAPDYNEKITLYQLNHLAGASGSRTKYSCPSCDKIKSQNLCFAIPDCDGIINPLQFRNKQKQS